MASTIPQRVDLKSDLVQSAINWYIPPTESIHTCIQFNALSISMIFPFWYSLIPFALGWYMAGQIFIEYNSTLSQLDISHLVRSLGTSRVSHTWEQLAILRVFNSIHGTIQYLPLRVFIPSYNSMHPPSIIFPIVSGHWVQAKPSNTWESPSLRWHLPSSEFNTLSMWYFPSCPVIGYKPSTLKSNPPSVRPPSL